MPRIIALPLHRNGGGPHSGAAVASWDRRPMPPARQVPRCKAMSAIGRTRPARIVYARTRFLLAVRGRLEDDLALNVLPADRAALLDQPGSAGRARARRIHALFHRPSRAAPLRTH